MVSHPPLEVAVADELEELESVEQLGTKRERRLSIMLGEGGGAPNRRFEAIAVMAGEGLPVEVSCRMLAVSCAGYYAWRFRPPSARTVRHAWLTDLIRAVHAESYGNYGAKRVHAELVLGRGIAVGHNPVAMLMQRAGIAGRVPSFVKRARR
jgi:hypothetical protein